MGYHHTVNVIVENDKGEICLVKRGSNCATLQNLYVLPGGRLEYGESIIEGAIRETFEETGLCISQKNLSLCYLNQRLKSDDRDSIVFDFYFYTTTWQGEPQNNEPDKHESVGFYNPDNISPILPHHLDAMKQRYQKIDIGVALPE